MFLVQAPGDLYLNAQIPVYHGTCPWLLVSHYAVAHDPSHPYVIAHDLSDLYVIAHDPRDLHVMAQGPGIPSLGV